MPGLSTTEVVTTAIPASIGKSKARRRETLHFYLCISPWLVMFILLGILPLLWGLYLSFENYTGYNFNNLHWIGWANYKDLFADQEALSDLWRSLYLSLIIVPLGTFVGYMLAVLLNNRLKGLGVYRTIFYLPSIFPIVATGLIWHVIFSHQNGILNQILSAIGLPSLNWLGFNLIPVSLVVMMLWGAGGGLMIYLAGLKGVPVSLLEAATIDGASTIRRFWHVTFPLTTPVIFYNVIMGIIGTLQIFIQPILLSASGGTALTSLPLSPVETYVAYVFSEIFSFYRYSYGLAMLWIMFVVVLIFSLILFATSRYWVYYESGEA